MAPHEEQGYFKEIYRSEESVSNHSPKMSSIYFLIKKGGITKFRQLKEIDELVVFLDGNPLEILMIDTNGKIEITKLGKNQLNDEKLEALIPAENIVCFKSVEDSSDFSLFSCICSPAFDYKYFKILNLDEIITFHPKLEIEKIKKFIRS